MVIMLQDDYTEYISIFDTLDQSQFQRRWRSRLGATWQILLSFLFFLSIILGVGRQV